MWAIKTNGLGNPVSARAIQPDWELAEGESFKVEVWEPGMILDADGATVRHPTAQELEETPEQIIKRLEGVLDRHLDAVAKSYRYESIRTMVTYATSDHPTFGPEGRAAVAFRDAVYSYGIAKIAACTRAVDPEPIPTEAELIAELPDIADYFE